MPEHQSEPAGERAAGSVDATDASGEAAAPAGPDERGASPVPDEVLLASAELAQRALLELTAPESVGSVIGHIVEDEHVLTLLFAADVPGYRGWHWAVTIARVEGGEPTVLESELMPGEGALLAPEWVPWSDRLAEYRAAQAAAAAEAAAASEADADEDDADGMPHDEDEDEDDEDDEDRDDDEDQDEDDEDDDDEDDDDEEDDDEEDDDADEFGVDDDFDDGIDIDAIGEPDGADAEDGSRSDADD